MKNRLQERLSISERWWSLKVGAPYGTDLQQLCWLVHAKAHAAVGGIPPVGMNNCWGNTPIMQKWLLSKETHLRLKVRSVGKKKSGLRTPLICKAR